MNPTKNPFDERANLYKQMVRIVKDKQPQVFIAENVKGLMTLHKGEIFKKIYKAFEDAGMRCVGENPETHLVEVVEVPSLRWYVGVQYHPEYNSTVLNPNPLFVDFIKAAISKK